MTTVLLVEDDPNKAERVRRLVDECGGSSLNVIQRDNAHDAFVWLREHKCDVLILDLQIPRRKGDLPDRAGGKQLLDKIVRAGSGCFVPSRTIGLTAYEDLRADFQQLFEREGWVVVKYDQTSSDWEEAVVNTVNHQISEVSDEYQTSGGVILPLHGIRTVADWHRALADVAQAERWVCPMHRWWYGRFSVFHILSPFSRAAKVRWFRKRYSETIVQYAAALRGGRLPSVIAHSFGTFILGNALLKFRDIRVDKVILCGSILPRDFPWDELLENGQVRAVLNDVGRDDIWPVVCSYVVQGSGSSGRKGFTRGHVRLTEEFHNLSHSEFFDPGQIREHWFKFLKMDVPDNGVRRVGCLRRPSGDHPWLSFLLCPIVFFILTAIAMGVVYCGAKVVSFGGDFLVRWLSSTMG